MELRAKTAELGGLRARLTEELGGREESEGALRKAQGELSVTAQEYAEAMSLIKDLRAEITSDAELR